MLNVNGKLEGWFTGNFMRDTKHPRKRNERLLKEFKKRKNNPYISSAIEYIEFHAFPIMEKYIDSITPDGYRIDYLFNDSKPWYVASNTVTQIYELEVVVSEPKVLTGGRIWFRLFVNGKEKNYDLEVEWNSDEMHVKITAEELARLCRNQLWNEPPKEPMLQAPMTYEMWQDQSGIKNKSPNDVCENLKKDMRKALKTMQLTEQTHILEEVANRLVEANPQIKFNTSEYTALIGKAVMQYREAERNGG